MLRRQGRRDLQAVVVGAAILLLALAGSRESITAARSLLVPVDPVWDRRADNHAKTKEVI